MGHLGPKRGQNEVLGPYLAQSALVFDHFAYRGWEWWSLVPDGCQSAEKKLLALKWAHFGLNWALKWVLGNYLNFGLYKMFNIAYSDSFE